MVLCIRYLHRHPIELSHLPPQVFADLVALAQAETELMEEEQGG